MSWDYQLKDYIPFYEKNKIKKPLKKRFLNSFGGLTILV